MTVGVQKHPWSSELFIEMGFFIPACIALTWLAWGGRLERISLGGPAATSAGPGSQPETAAQPAPTEGVAAELLQALKAPRAGETEKATP
jgi:hypothetical protein